MAKEIENEKTLYGLFIMADGNISYEEEKMLIQICHGMGSSINEANINNLRTLSKRNTNIYQEIVKANLAYSIEHPYADGTFDFFRKSKSSLARIVWNLINLGYADSTFSVKEKEIVDYLVKKWEISPVIYQEFIDVAETMLALSEQKDWIKTLSISKYSKDQMEKRVDNQIKQLLNDVTITLEELTM